MGVVIVWRSGGVYGVTRSERDRWYGSYGSNTSGIIRVPAMRARMKAMTVSPNEKETTKGEGMYTSQMIMPMQDVVPVGHQ